MADKQWFYAHGDEQAGPVSSAELKKLADEGKLDAEDLVWREGMDDWKPAGEMKGLIGKSPAAPHPKKAKKAPAKSAAKKVETKKEAPQSEAPAKEAAVEISLPEEAEAEPATETPAIETDDAEPDPVGDSFDLGLSEEPAAVEETPTFEAPAEEPSQPEPEPEEEPAPAVERKSTHRAPSSVSSSAVAESSPQPSRGLLMVQLLLWVCCLAIVVVGAVFFVPQWSNADDPGDKTSTGVAFLVLFVAIYTAARAGDRILNLFAELGKKK